MTVNENPAWKAALQRPERAGLPVDARPRPLSSTLPCGWGWGWAWGCALLMGAMASTFSVVPCVHDSQADQLSDEPQITWWYEVN